MYCRLRRAQSCEMTVLYEDETTHPYIQVSHPEDPTHVLDGTRFPILSLPTEKPFCPGRTPNIKCDGFWLMFFFFCQFIQKYLHCFHYLYKMLPINILLQGDMTLSVQSMLGLHRKSGAAVTLGSTLCCIY